MREFNKHELSLRNGKDREEVWVCVDGLIYDVSASRLWSTGIHYDHWAGQELDDELKDAPHLPEVLKKFPVIGKIKR